MKYKLRAKVDGTLFLQSANRRIRARRGDHEFEVESDSSSRVIAVSVSARVPENLESEFFATMESTPDDEVKLHLMFGADSSFHNEIIGQLQATESLLAFNWKGHPLKRVHWHEAEKSLVPETEEERQRVAFSGLLSQRPVPVIPCLVTDDYFTRLVVDGPRFEELTIPIAFWREGMNHYERGEFVLAYYSYYFVLEDLFADGKTSARAVLRAFASSDEFVTICEEARESLLRRPDRHGDRLREQFAKAECELDVPGVQEFLFRMRGNTHHYSGRSSKPQPTPFNQHEFESVALMGMWFATNSLVRRKADIAANRTSNA